LQSIVSRETDPGESAVVTIGRIAAGSASNIIPDTAILEGTIRALSTETMDRTAESVRRIAENTAVAFRAEAKVTLGSQSYPPTVNDPGMAQFARQTLSDALGRDNVVEVNTPSMTAEDFSFYLRKAPGVFLWLGNAPADNRPSPVLHSPCFDFNDAAIPVGLNVLSSLAVNFLERHAG